MFHFDYLTENTCSQLISLDLDGDVVRNIVFTGGCNGNLKAISKLVEGKNAEEIIPVLKGNTCGLKKTSCADQLALALEEAKKQIK